MSSRVRISAGVITFGLRGGELDRQRNPVEACTQIVHRRRVRRIHGEIAARSTARATNSPPASEASTEHAVPRFGHPQRPQRKRALARHAERLATRHQHRNSRRARRGRGHERRHRTHEVLAIVDQQQHFLALQVPGQPVGNRDTLGWRVSHRGRDRAGKISGLDAPKRAHTTTRRRRVPAAVRTRPATRGGSCRHPLRQRSRQPATHAPTPPPRGARPRVPTKLLNSYGKFDR